MADTMRITKTLGTHGTFVFDSDLFESARLRTKVELYREVREGAPEITGWSKLRKDELAVIVADWATGARDNERAADVADAARFDLQLTESLAEAGERESWYRGKPRITSAEVAEMLAPKMAERYADGWEFYSRTDAYLRETFDIWASNTGSSAIEMMYQAGMAAIVDECHDRALRIERARTGYRLRNTTTGTTYLVHGTGPAKNAPHRTAVWVQMEGEKGVSPWSPADMVSNWHPVVAVDEHGNQQPPCCSLCVARKARAAVQPCCSLRTRGVDCGCADGAADRLSGFEPEDDEACTASVHDGPGPEDGRECGEPVVPGTDRCAEHKSPTPLADFGRDFPHVNAVLCAGLGQATELAQAAERDRGKGHALHMALRGEINAAHAQRDLIGRELPATDVGEALADLVKNSDPVHRMGRALDRETGNTCTPVACIGGCQGLRPCNLVDSSHDVRKANEAATDMSGLPVNVVSLLWTDEWEYDDQYRHGGYAACYAHKDCGQRYYANEYRTLGGLVRAMLSHNACCEG